MIKDFEDPAATSIKGVTFKKLATHPDDRGFFRELVRKTDPFFGAGFGQWSHSKMALNTVKAWHFHHLQSDWWYCPIGIIHTALYDMREESPTYKQKIEFKLGDPSLGPDVLCSVVEIPPGVAHGCRVLTTEAHLFYITSHTYNPDDEGRLPFNTDIIPHFWGDPNQVITSEKDRRTFVPTNPRARLG